MTEQEDFNSYLKIQKEEENLLTLMIELCEGEFNSLDFRKLQLDQKEICENPIIKTISIKGKRKWTLEKVRPLLTVILVPFKKEVFTDFEEKKGEKPFYFRPVFFSTQIFEIKNILKRQTEFEMMEELTQLNLDKSKIITSNQKEVINQVFLSENLED